MKCYKHATEEVVGQCADCGVFLCEECYNVNELHFCDACAKKRKSKLIVTFVRNIVLMLILIPIFVTIFQDSLFGALFGAGIPFGWTAISKFKFGIFVGGNFLFFYVVFKLVLAGLIGIFLTPFAILKMYNEYSSLTKQLEGNKTELSYK